jgi:hypothetical protein
MFAVSWKLSLVSFSSVFVIAVLKTCIQNKCDKKEEEVKK